MFNARSVSKGPSDWAVLIRHLYVSPSLGCGFLHLKTTSLPVRVITRRGKAFDVGNSTAVQRIRGRFAHRFGRHRLRHGANLPGQCPRRRRRPARQRPPPTARGSACCGQRGPPSGASCTGCGLLTVAAMSASLRLSRPAGPPCQPPCCPAEPRWTVASSVASFPAPAVRCCRDAAPQHGALRPVIVLIRACRPAPEPGRRRCRAVPKA